MSTYAENQAARERSERKAAQDQFLRCQTAEFDLSAQDQHMKYERPSFTVVTSSDAFRVGYDNIRWTDEAKELVVEPVNQSGPARE